MSKFDDHKSAIEFIYGGNAVFTIKSLKTDKHFTYKVTQAKRERERDAAPYFVRVLAGPDNQDWAASQYIGFLKEYALPVDADPLLAGKKGKPDAPSFKALQWVLMKLYRRDMDGFEIMHEGRCCRCNRALTHPDSIKTGIGPECAKHFG